MAHIIAGKKVEIATDHKNSVALYSPSYPRTKTLGARQRPSRLDMNTQNAQCARHETKVDLLRTPSANNILSDQGRLRHYTKAHFRNNATPQCTRFFVAEVPKRPQVLAGCRQQSKQYDVARFQQRHQESAPARVEARDVFVGLNRSKELPISGRDSRLPLRTLGPAEDDSIDRPIVRILTIRLLPWYDSSCCSSPDSWGLMAGRSK